ncbi:MAG: hypothetical protein IJB79_00520 [Candidatus Gastranaerophilales bacterium]|nr:hypothetical protein [Candidatus Gastranaerophilales bacterium]
MDIKHSLTYFRKQEGWIKIYGALIIAIFVGAIPIIGTIIYPIFQFGYMTVLTNHRIFKPEIPLAQWDTGKIFKAGAKAASPIIALAIVLNIIANGISKNPELAIQIAFPLCAICLIFGIIYDLALLVFMTNLKFNSMFKTNAMKFILIDNCKEYIVFSLIKFFITICFLIVTAISAITLIGPILLMPSLLFIIADLNAQFLRKIFKINTNPTQG